ncbi:MAG TPA: glycosyltransferase [Gemmatimonadaceae bacterium]|nr:glycosyltransferase [Gemmatimonadaceae bacterium]
MTFTVLNVAYSLAVVGPNAVGGAEQVLARIDRALVDGGATSIVVSCTGSTPAGLLCATPRASGVLDEAACAAARRAHADAIARTLDRHGVDLVHMHGVDFHSYLPDAGVPVLATLHLAPGCYPRAVFESARPGTYLNCVSRAQERTCPASPALVATIENGIDIPEVVRRGAGDYVMALGRICPEKGFHIAMDAARRAGVPMLLAGQVFPYPEHERYFTDLILPRLGDRCGFVGAVAGDQKTHMLARARCVLVPSLVAETSSLVAMEALACGTPVIAFDVGALPELVEHGVTGFIVRDEREMADAIIAASALDPEACRAAAVERFSSTRMVREYLALYRALAQGAGAADRSRCVA